MLASRLQGCGSSKGESGTTAGGPPQAQTQGDAEKDAAAAEIQKAAKVFKEKKEADAAEKRKDEAAAEIQGGAAAYLAKKREEKAKAEKDSQNEGGGMMGAIIGFFSGRDAAAAPAPATAAAPVAPAPAAAPEAAAPASAPAPAA